LGLEVNEHDGGEEPLEPGSIIEWVATMEVEGTCRGDRGTYITDERGDEVVVSFGGRSFVCSKDAIKKVDQPSA
jgi:hypothetical protein